VTTSPAVQEPAKARSGKRTLDSARFDDLAKLRAEIEQIRVDRDRLELAAVSANQGAWEYVVASGKTYVSPMVFSLLGYEGQDICDHRSFFEDRVDASDLVSCVSHWTDFLAGQTQAFVAEMRVRCCDGTVRWWLTRAVAIRDKSGRAIRVNGSVVDITRRRKAEAELKQSVERHRAIFDSLPMPMYVVDPDTLGFLDVNNAAIKQYGYTRGEFLKLNLVDIRPAEYAAPVRKSFKKHFGRESAYVGVWTHMRKDGSLLSVEITCTTITSPDGRQTLLGMAKDITDRLTAQRALEESEHRLSSLFDHATEGIYQILTTGRFLKVNPALARMFGYASPAELMDDACDGSESLYMQPGRRDELTKLMLAEGQIEDLISEGRRRDGSPIWISENARCVRGTDGEVLYFEGFVENVTDRIAADAARERMLEEALASADCDPLTGLLNHRAFHRRLEDEVERTQRMGGSLAVIVIDLDNFKFFNDAYGHEAGDTVLRTVASNLRASCRSYDILGRFGGDEFAVVMPDASPAAAANLESRLRALMQESGYQPADYDAKIPLGVSIGYALFPDEVPTRSEIINLADQRLRRSKAGNEMDSVCDRLRANYLSRISGFKILDALVTAVDNKDRYTRKHSEDVMLFAQQIAAELGLDGATMDLIQLTALLHDVGKIGVPDSILRKPGRLTEEETLAIQQHAPMGAMIVSAVPGFAATLEGIRNHHERWDGAGYPDKLAAKDIPQIARILSVADAFSAMTTNRPYRTSMPQKKALAILKEGAGSQWDPACVDAFLRARGVLSGPKSS
jgi:diguanylate cyclase (GGDEF)-like protein/PAS domain S-box-containing protein